MATYRRETKTRHPDSFHFVALMGGNLALAFGPWFVRLADSGPVSAGLWRLVLPLPLLALLARANRQPLTGFGWGSLGAVALAGVLFALDLASWHVGIEKTKLGNASLFGNSGSLILMVWGMVAARRAPRWAEVAAMILALAGSAILMGRSLEIDTSTLVGDLFCVLAGFFYFFYILLIQHARGRFGSWSLLFHASWTGAPVLLVCALWLGEPVWPHTWWPVIGLAIASQVIGQGLLVYALGHFSPLVIGLALLSQPVVSVIAGWAAFGETIGVVDGLGMVLVAVSLVLARVGEPARTADAPD
ncbi:DMT family transporter [Novosphingobium cyanobacteriorum]|uniref:DMT family transporter n=1 Tax=Novosphingobium cyanobacteriorum TaxID=3024215 RepID=A0ABT6CGA8_9SPHN|nr:DMT family transporter [Novosphingobium cyanobacteriorum]MDF8332964.1 DMT family transporter [Novosphingobium cyanobacteriorum]